MRLEDISIHAWIFENNIKTEKGIPIDLRNHLFLFDPYTDMSQNQVCYKAAQIGFSTMAILKALYVAKTKKIDLIYTLPTDGDVSVFVGGKVNRIIQNNPILQQWTKDKDTVEQKKIGDYMTYWRGTFTKRSAISVTSDLNIHDEIDFSDQEVIEDYESRLQHSQYKGRWVFGHPSTLGVGVAKYWDKSDQKHWFIRCPSCKKEHFMKWPESVCKDRKVFICKLCKAPLSNEDRRKGRWVARYKNKEFSGYWIPLLIAPWIDAKYILEKHKTKSEEFFYNRILGLPYVGSGNKVTKDIILGNLVNELHPMTGRIVIGCDTGTHLRYTVGNIAGIFHYGEAKDEKDSRGRVMTNKYDTIEKMLKRWPKAIVVFDQGGGPGDSTAVRELRDKYPGRVFIAFYREDRKSTELIKWDDKNNSVIIDRNNVIQLVIDEFADRRIPIYGTEADWWDYWLHWDKIYRVSEETALGTLKYKWLRSGRDDWVHSTIYWRVGMSRFATGEGVIFQNNTEEMPVSHTVDPDQTVTFNPRKQAMAKIPMPDNDWRII